MPNDDRQLTLYKPELSGDKELLVRRVEGHEGLSELFSYEVTLYAKSDSIKAKDVLGLHMCIGLKQPQSKSVEARGAARERNKERFFHGFIASFAHGGSDGEFTVYRAQIKPDLWRLTLATNCRIFQDESVPNIVKEVMRAYRIDLDDKGLETGNRQVTYLPRNYCVQYRESDFAFVSRLLEQEGIHYYFRHSKDGHKLILADSSHDGPEYRTIEDYDEVEYTVAANMANRREEAIWDWATSYNVLPDKVALGDYDFTSPRSRASLQSDSGSDTKRADLENREDTFEVYDYQESIVTQTGHAEQLVNDYCRVRAEELHVGYAVSSGQTDARGLCAGAIFKFKNHAIKGPKSAENESYVILRTQLCAEMDVRSSRSGSASAPVYQCSFEAITHKTSYRPPRVTEKPIIAGPQSATVAGKSAQDIDVDKYGRVYVKFHWARKIKSDDKVLSCWVRVSQNSAGANWGSMFVPHVGQEVLVGFLEGDPDRPVVIGKVYNGDNMPPFALPDFKHKSIIRDHFGNQIVFDGTPGDEHLALHSPSHSSVMLLGKSKKTFTHSTDASAAYDTCSYTFGTNRSYVRGTSYSLRKGTSIWLASGINASATLGLSLKLAISNSYECKTGLALSLQRSASMSFGFSRDLKKAKGIYTRCSDDDMLIDSKKAVYVSGGKHDRTMLVSADDEISLSYDESSPSRVAEFEQADKEALGMAAVFGALSALGAGVGASDYQYISHTKELQHKDPKGNVITSTVGAELDQFTKFTAGDELLLLGGVAAIAGACNAQSVNISAPKHATPESKVGLGKNWVLLFAGKEKDAQLELRKATGIALQTKKTVTIKADKDVLVNASNKIVLEAKRVNISGEITHKNFKVLP